MLINVNTQIHLDNTEMETSENIFIAEYIRNYKRSISFFVPGGGGHSVI